MAVSGVPSEVQQNPLYRDSNTNPFAGMLPGDMALFRVDDRGRWGDATFAWILRETEPVPYFEALEYTFERIGDGYRITVGVYSDGSGYMPNAQIFRRLERAPVPPLSDK